MEFSDSLAVSIIEKIGARKEAWLVFDMDETLAHWGFFLKKANSGNKDIPAANFYRKYTEEVEEKKIILRPTLVPFLQRILKSDVTINFAIYSNSHKADRVEFIAHTIENALGNNPKFRICFLFHNNFMKPRPGVQRVNKNIETSPKYTPNKTVESISHGFRESGVPLTEEDISTHLFFFDDVDYPSIRAKISDNYIQVAEFKGEAEPAAPSRGTKRNASGTAKKRRSRLSGGRLSQRRDHLKKTRRIRR